MTGLLGLLGPLNGNYHIGGTHSRILMREGPSTELIHDTWSDNHHSRDRDNRLWDPDEGNVPGFVSQMENEG